MVLDKNVAKIVGEALFLSSISAALASIEMSSKFSVMNFSKDDETLQNAADALRGYLIIGGIWAVGTVLVMYASHGMLGAIAGLLANLVMLGWIYFSYIYSFKQAALKYNLTVPKVFNKNLIFFSVGMTLLIIVGFLYLTPNGTNYVSEFISF